MKTGRRREGTRVVPFQARTQQTQAKQTVGHTPGPLELRYDETAAKFKKMTGKPLDQWDGHSRDNDGNWLGIVDADGSGVAMARIRVEAKRGQGWITADPEGLANAKRIVQTWNAHDGLVAACRGLITALRTQMKMARACGGDIAVNEGNAVAWTAATDALVKAVVGTIGG